MAEFTIKVSEDESALDIAVKTFNGTDTNRRLWQWYLEHMALQEGSVDKAESEFSDLVRFVATTLERDGTPDTMPARNGRPAKCHIHARAFHKFLKKMCANRYGDMNTYRGRGAQ